MITNTFSFWEIFLPFGNQKNSTVTYTKKGFLLGGGGKKKAPKSPDFLGFFFPL
jgi:hypothetical protein